VEFRTSADAGVLIVNVSGRLDSVTSPRLDAEVRRQLDAGQRRLVFDLSQLEYISSAGLRVLLAAARQLRGQGAVAVAGPNDLVRQVIEIAGVTGFIQICDDTGDATAALQSRQP
jgi:anti-anti-sigma factor